MKEYEETANFKTHEPVESGQRIFWKGGHLYRDDFKMVTEKDWRDRPSDLHPSDSCIADSDEIREHYDRMRIWRCDEDEEKVGRRICKKDLKVEHENEDQVREDTTGHYYTITDNAFPTKEGEVTGKQPLKSGQGQIEHEIATAHSSTSTGKSSQQDETKDGKCLEDREPPYQEEDADNKTEYEQEPKGESDWAIHSQKRSHVTKSRHLRGRDIEPVHDGSVEPCCDGDDM